MSGIGTNPSTVIQYLSLYSHSADAIDPLLDTEPIDIRKMLRGVFQRKFSGFKSVAALARTGEITPY